MSGATKGLTEKIRQRRVEGTFNGKKHTAAVQHRKKNKAPHYKCGALFIKQPGEETVAFFVWLPGTDSNRRQGG